MTNFGFGYKKTTTTVLILGFIFVIIKIIISLSVLGFVCYGVYYVCDQGLAQFITSVGIGIKHIIIDIINS